MHLSSDELAQLGTQLGQSCPIERLSLRRGCALLLALALLPAAFSITLVWLLWGLSRWSAVLALGSTVLCLGLAAISQRARFAKTVASAGLAIVVGPWIFRSVLVRGTDELRMTTLPGDRATRLVDTLYPERDGSLAAAGLLGLARGLRDDHARDFRQILDHGYARMAKVAVASPTPAIATYLGLQSPSGFDTIVMPNAHGPLAADAGVIFLHGFAGNFYVYCWEMAQAARAANLVTLCYARKYATRGSNVRYHEVPGGHLVFLSKYERVRPVIGAFLASLERSH